MDVWKGGGGGKKSTGCFQNFCFISSIILREFSARNFILQLSFPVYFLNAKEFRPVAEPRGGGGVGRGVNPPTFLKIW